MIRTLYYSLKIDTYYAINSFIYLLRKLPILKDLFTEDAYTSKILKLLSGFFGILLSFTKMVFSRYLYFLIIYIISNYISKDNRTFYHVFFIFSIIGMFINNKLLTANMKKYLSIVVFKMDAKNYLKYNLFWTLLTNLSLNSLCFYLFNLDMKIGFILVLFQLGVRVIGESLELMYFRKYANFWYNNTFLYFSILSILLLFSFSPAINLFINQDMIFISTLASIVISVVSYFYICSFNDYTSIFKRINTLSNAINNDLSNNRQSIVEVKKKDIQIDEKKISTKNGYDYFNTIFFERHRDILLRTVKFISFVLIVSYIILGIFAIDNKEFSIMLNDFLSNRLGWFVLIMYFINRGSIVTQAMFYNCDHAMLKYNFYREPSVIIGLFKMRLKTISQINLLPALIISFGNAILLFIGGETSVLNFVGMFLFIILLSVFFSLHYLVIYYLLQPYNQEMQMKKLSYSVVSLITYLICYWASKLYVSSLTFSIIGLVLCIIYILISLKIVENYAPRTFKIN